MSRVCDGAPRDDVDDDEAAATDAAVTSTTVVAAAADWVTSTVMRLQWLMLLWRQRLLLLLLRLTEIFVVEVQWRTRQIRLHMDLCHQLTSVAWRHDGSAVHHSCGHITQLPANPPSRIQCLFTVDCRYKIERDTHDNNNMLYRVQSQRLLKRPRLALHSVSLL